MITKNSWEILKREQKKLDKLIYQQRTIDLDWNSLVNAERLKLNILVEIGEFANELKTFKLWRNKKEVDLAKAKEELIDCLCFFLGLCNMYKINFLEQIFQILNKDLSFNDLLLAFFSKTNNLFIEKSENAYKSENIEFNKEEISTYHNWLQIFNEINLRLGINEEELVNIYKQKNEINHQRVRLGGH